MKFEYSDDYATKFGDFTEINFEERTFANDLIESWQSLVESLTKPYNDVLEEFSFDVSSLRESIDLCINEKSLADFDDHKIFEEKIILLDKVFINLTQEHPDWQNFINFNWWEKRVPKKVTPKFFYGTERDCYEKVGLQFEIVE